jgi:hypothetical protein
LGKKPETNKFILSVIKTNEMCALKLRYPKYLIVSARAFSPAVPLSMSSIQSNKKYKMFTNTSPYTYIPTPAL